MGEVDQAIHEVNRLRSVGEQMSGFDAAAWRTAVKDRGVRNVMVGLTLLDSRPDWEKIKVRFERLTRIMPILRERPLFGAMGVSFPRMALDPDFDLDLHVRRSRLPEGAGWDDVLAEARRLSLMDFDHDRPLWEALLLEGLPGDRAALMIKLHHSIADGQAAVIMAANLFEFTPNGNPDEPEAPPAPKADPVSMARVSGANIKDNVNRVVEVAKGSVKVAADLAKGSVKDPMKTWVEAFGIARSLTKFTEIPDSELSPLMTGRSTTYTFATFETTFAEMRAAAKGYDSTVNDVFMASVTTGFAKYHERHGKPTRRLRFNLPISLRTDGDTQASNAVTIARFPLPVNGVNVKERLRAAHNEVKKWREEPALPLVNPVADVSWFVPVPVLAETMRKSDVTTSNVPGPPIPIYIAGAEVAGTWPLVGTIGAAVNITMVTYNGSAFFGISVDDAAVPDVEDLIADLRAGFEAVLGDTVGPADPVSDPILGEPSQAHVLAGAKRPEKKDKPAKKAAAKKAPAKKAAGKKAAAKKAPAKKAPAKKAPAKKAPAKKVPAKKAAAKKAPAKKAPAKKA